MTYGRDQYPRQPRYAQPPAHEPYGQELYTHDAYGGPPYTEDPYRRDPYAQDPYRADPYGADPYSRPPQGRPPQAPPPAQPPPPPEQPRERSGVHPAFLAGVSIWRLAIVVCALYGFSDATGWTENFEALSQLASLLTGVVYLGLLVYPLLTRGQRHEPESPWLRGATCVVMLLVAGAFFTLMDGDPSYLPFEHIVTPALVLIDWIVVGRNQAKAKFWHPITWVFFPLAYFVYFLATGLYDSLYSFLDPENAEFVVTMLGLFAGVLVAGYVLYAIGKIRGLVTLGF